MADQYLLPCPACQEKLPVETRQAGTSVRCSCGAQLQVPALRQLHSLQRVETEAEQKPPREWGPRQGLMLLGLTVLVAAGSAAGYCAAIRPVDERLGLEELIRSHHQAIDKMPIDATWRVWKLEMLGIGLNDLPTEYDRYYERRSRELNHWTITALVGAGFGAALILAGLLYSKKPRPAPKKGPPTGRS